MAGRLIAIGDIHGCDRALAAVLDQIRPQSQDRIVVLGDVVDRGPQTRQAVDRLIALEPRCQFRMLMGNHEEMMLGVVTLKRPPHLWLQYGGADTLDSYGFRGNLDVIPQQHIAFLSAGKNFVETESHFFVHANYDANLPLERQPASLLRWTRLEAALPGPHLSGKQAIVGHTHDLSGEVFSLPHLKCIDTWCYGEGWLTALEVNTGQLWQADKQGTLRGGVGRDSR